MFVKFNVFDARLILETVKSHKTTNQSLSGCFITYWQYKETIAQERYNDR